MQILKQHMVGKKYREIHQQYVLDFNSKVGKIEVHCDTVRNKLRKQKEADKNDESINQKILYNGKYLQNYFFLEIHNIINKLLLGIIKNIEREREKKALIHNIRSKTADIQKIKNHNFKQLCNHLST